jgi:hypothetical protein
MGLVVLQKAMKRDSSKAQVQDGHMSGQGTVLLFQHDSSAHARAQVTAANYCVHMLC